MSAALILPGHNHCFVIADLGTTDHMLPDKSTFISYKLVTNLQVCMGNNSYLPVLSQGSAVVSLNGQRILVHNALHVPGLVVPCYSLRAHFWHPAVDLLARPALASLSTSLPLSYWWIHPRTAIWHTSL
jgi:hypothetical protein